MRLFTGLSIPADVERPVVAAVEALRPLVSLRWSPAGNLHITSKFIGDWPEARLGELEAALASMESPGPFSVTVGGYGFLPAAQRPKIFFAGVRGEPGLMELAARTDLALGNIGIKRETHRYTPHLTLARIRDEDPAVLRGQIGPEFGSFTVVEYHLYLSRPGSAGSEYSVIRSYPL